MPIQQMLLGAAATIPPQQEYLEAGNYTWVCPAGVTSVSVVAIGPGGAGENKGSYGGGDGGCAAKNNITVTPGSSYDVIVGVRGLHGSTETSATESKGFIIGGNYAVIAAPGGNGESPSNGIAATAAQCTGDFKYEGGNGGGSNAGGKKGGGSNTTTPPPNGDGVDGGTGSSGGGAGGNGGGGGGAGATSGGSWITARGGGGSASANSNCIGGGGGGGGTTSNGWGAGGGGGGNLGTGTGGSAPTNGVSGVLWYGGGGGRWGAGGGACGKTVTAGNEGGHGAFRIIWPGDTRQFPFTNVTDQ